MHIEPIYYHPAIGLEASGQQVKPEHDSTLDGYQVHDGDKIIAAFTDRDVASWFVDAYPAARPDVLAPYEENVTYGYLPDDVRPTCPHCRHTVEQPDHVQFPEEPWYGRCGQCGLAEWFQLDEDEDHG